MSSSAAARANQRNKANQRNALVDARDRPALLLAWYDRHRRQLPWRSAPGERADPYRVWLSEIMLQQTTVKAVGPDFAKFLARWPDVEALAAARSTTSSRPGPGSAITRVRAIFTPVRRRWPRDMAAFFPIPKPACRRCRESAAYTAAAIAAIAFDRRTMPVDGNIERVVARLYAIEEANCRRPSRIFALGRRAAAPSAAPAIYAGADGSRRYDLHAEETGLRALSPDEDCAAACAATRRRSRARRRRRPARCAAARLSSSRAATACWCARVPRRVCLAA